MSADWLEALWPFVRDALPAAPAHVVEIGCGPAGGFVPHLEAAGYDPVGVDPEAPDGPRFHRMEFEGYEPAASVDAVVACTSLHHVDDLERVVDRIAAALRPGGTLVVVEWASERFDEHTARWCFDRLPAGDGDGWLHRHARAWRESGADWATYVEGWAEAERLHRSDRIVTALDRRFRTRSSTETPYFFADLGISEDDERAAGVALTGLRYVGVAV
ncbi:methyltransferase domain-containing protein [Asanoa sp. NPDC049518]|uniref:class I SAM-dependent methyltransferase n=1 Tax=unclassified Asanoa TaxID=2685164 RepID=UPI0034377D6C